PLLMVALCACSGDRRSQDSAINSIVMKYHEAGKFTGSVLVGRDDRVVYVRSIGLADESWRVSNTAETRFQIGSLTKQFTAAFILGLVQQRRIDLDAPLSTYLPDYRAESGRLVGGSARYWHQWTSRCGAASRDCLCRREWPAGKSSLHRMVRYVRVRRIVFVGTRPVAVAVRADGRYGA